MRKFEKVSIVEFGKKNDINCYEDVKIPRRSTKNSAGYDFVLPYDVTIKPHEKAIIATGIKAKMESDEFLMVVVRSSLGVKRGLQMANQVGIIDSDYYNNLDNEGHIFITLVNTTGNIIDLAKGERIAQGIFLKYYKTSDEEEVIDTRKGGIGSTN